jgi:hypothetical protein
MREFLRETWIIWAAVLAFFVMFGSLLLVQATHIVAFDFLAANGGWCCAKKRSWCRPSSTCVEWSSSTPAACKTWVPGEYCQDLCDQWEKRPGGRGEECSR